jgi:hypothetical protein
MERNEENGRANSVLEDKNNNREDLKSREKNRSKDLIRKDTKTLEERAFGRLEKEPDLICLNKNKD